jgi:hypothetical protein
MGTVKGCMQGSGAGSNKECIAGVAACDDDESAWLDFIWLEGYGNFRVENAFAHRAVYTGRFCPWRRFFLVSMAKIRRPLHNLLKAPRHPLRPSQKRRHIVLHKLPSPELLSPPSSPTTSSVPLESPSPSASQTTDCSSAAPHSAALVSNRELPPADRTTPRR